jgi:hypothetical protein
MISSNKNTNNSYLYNNYNNNSTYLQPHNLSSSQSQQNGLTTINMRKIIFTLRFLCLLTSFLNVKIFSKSKFNKPIHKSLLYVSICDLIYSFSLLIMGLLAYIDTYYSNSNSDLHFLFYVFYILLSEYLTNCLSFFNILMEIRMTFQRILLLKLNSTKTSCKEENKNSLIVFLMGLFSMIIFVPVLFMHKIVTNDSNNNNNNSVYLLLWSDFGRTYLAKLYLKLIKSVRISLVIIVLLILNIIAIIRYRSYIKNKTHLKRLNCKLFFFYFFLNFLLMN